jgi:DNA-binding beta-propeller fold protein YncE
VFVADRDNRRVQVLTPTLDFRCTIGVGALSLCGGVCASVDVVAVSEELVGRVSVFNRRDGALLRHFGSKGKAAGHLTAPCGLCFMNGDRHLAVADRDNSRVSVFSIDGHFIRHVGVGVLHRPVGVACSAFDEIIVADAGNRRVVVFSDIGDVLMTFGGGSDFIGVVVHGSTVFAQDMIAQRCVLWS